MDISGFRGRQETRDMKRSDMKEGSDDTGTFLEFRERVTKTRNGVKNNARAFRPRAYANEENPRRCPVMLYRAYASHRPLPMMHDDAPFYLAVNNMTKDLANARKWYKCSALGANTIGTFIKKHVKECWTYLKIHQPFHSENCNHQFAESRIRPNTHPTN